MDSSRPFVVHYKIHSSKEGPRCDICVILSFIYVHNAITNACIIYGSTTLLMNIRI